MRERESKVSLFRTVAFHYLVLALLLPVAARADDAALATVMHDLAAVKSASGHFIETKTLSALTETLRSEGTLTYTAPDHVEKTTTSPEPLQMAVTGDELTVTREGRAHHVALSDHPEIQVFVESIRATLAGDLPTLRQYYTVAFTGTADRWELLLQPTDAEVQKLVTSIRITGSHAKLETIATVEANGDDSAMTITPVAP